MSLIPEIALLDDLIEGHLRAKAPPDGVHEPAPAQAMRAPADNDADGRKKGAETLDELVGPQSPNDCNEINSPGQNL